MDWDLYNIPHHCSYLALGPDKGYNKTEPTGNVAELLRHGQNDAYIVSSSNPIGSDQVAYEASQPPHVQARNTYEEFLKEVGGRRFLITMEHPSAAQPEPIVFEISASGGNLAFKRSASAAIISSPAPRAG
jgi:hypothetical protein